MKKMLSLTLALCLALSLAACSGAGSTAPSSSGASSAASSEPTPSPSPDALPTEDSLGTGMLAALDDKGTATITAAAVAVNADGTLSAVRLDVLQAAVTAEGDAYALDAGATKKELGFDYGMAKASPIAKEWFEQAEAYEAWCVGKTLDEVLAGVSAEGTPADADLLAGCTIHVDDFAAAIAKAVRLATPAQLSGSLCLDLSAALDGKTVNATAAAVLMQEDGTVAASFVDVLQGTLSGTEPVSMTADRSKKELGYDYGMAKASAIGKEWFEQAEALEAWSVGKTAEGLLSGADENGTAADADLAAGCTIHINGLTAALADAAAA